MKNNEFEKMCQKAGIKKEILCDTIFTKQFKEKNKITKVKMKRIIVGAHEAKSKLYAPKSFFNAMGFGVDIIYGIKAYCKNYYLTKTEGDLMERHMTALGAIPINFTIETITK